MIGRKSPETLEHLYVEELRDLYSAEHQILKALPKMIKSVHNPELRQALEDHERVTEEQVTRLDRIFRQLGEKPGRKKCPGMEGILEEGEELIKEKPEPEVLDAGLISKAQHVEHYEIAGYGTVRTWARTLGLDDQADLLEQSLEEEKEADRTLTQLAEADLNEEAARSESDEEEPPRRAQAMEPRRGGARGDRDRDVPQWQPEYEPRREPRRQKPGEPVDPEANRGGGRQRAGGGREEHRQGWSGRLRGEQERRPEPRVRGFEERESERQRRDRDRDIEGRRNDRDNE